MDFERPLAEKLTFRLPVQGRLRTLRRHAAHLVIVYELAKRLPINSSNVKKHMIVLGFERALLSDLRTYSLDLALNWFVAAKMAGAQLTLGRDYYALPGFGD